MSGANYGFRVRARNIFGWGPTSEVTTIQAAGKPGIPVAPVTSIDASGAMAIAWTAPDARGSAITAYTIEIQSKLDPSKMYTDAPCSATSPTDPAALKCLVLMSTLMFSDTTSLTNLAPYGYSFNDVVLVRVTAANLYGAGDPSPWSDATNGAKIRVVPAKMAAPTIHANSTD
jgi:hypothetical protein